MAAFGVAPEALDAVDVDARCTEDRLVRIGVLVDPVVAREARLDQAMISGKAVGGDLGLWGDLALQDGGKRCFRTVFHDLAMDTPAAFKEAENRGLAARTPPALAPDTGRSEVAFVDLDLTAEGATVATSPITCI
jgi:hypothetical protein